MQLYNLEWFFVELYESDKCFSNDFSWVYKINSMRLSWLGILFCNLSIKQ